MTESAWFTILFLIAAIFGIRGSWRVTQRYRAMRDDLDIHERLIPLLLAGICWVITCAAGYYGFLSVRTLLGFERISGIAALSVLLAAAILFLPTVIDLVEERVDRGSWR